jgi:hypothetical protein
VTPGLERHVGIAERHCAIRGDPVVGDELLLRLSVAVAGLPALRELGLELLLAQLLAPLLNLAIAAQLLTLGHPRLLTRETLLTLDVARLLALEGAAMLDVTRLLALEGAAMLDVARLLALEGAAVLDVAGLLALQGAAVLDVARLLALHRAAVLNGARLLPFDALHAWSRRAAMAAAMSTAALHHERGPAATAAAPERRRSAAVAATAATNCRCSAATMITAPVTAAGGRGRTSAIAVAAARLCYRRARNRQRGDARGEKQPSHRKISFRTGKRPVRVTVPTAKRMEPTA